MNTALDVNAWSPSAAVLDCAASMPSSSGGDNARPLRILHVLSGVDRGGAELGTLEIARHLNGKWYRFDFCTLSGRSGSLAAEIRSLGGDVFPIALRGTGFSRRFAALVRRGRYDVVQSHVHHASGFILRIAARRGVPGRVACFHSSHDGRSGCIFRKTYRKLMRRWIDTYATAVVANSRATMESVWSRGWSSDPRYRVIYFGVAPGVLKAESDRQRVCREFGLPSDAPLYIHVGRMTEAKNHLRLLSIFAATRSRQQQARLLLVGPGGNRVERTVRRRITELGLAGSVVLCGERGDVPRLLASADVMIFPSLWEGLGLAVLESCAVGTPVVASDLPCLREVAAELPGVHLLSLREDDGSWARRVAETAVVGRSGIHRPAARKRFLASSFNFARSVERLCGVWRGSHVATGSGAGDDG